MKVQIESVPELADQTGQSQALDELRLRIFVDLNGDYTTMDLGFTGVCPRGFQDRLQLGQGQFRMVASQQCQQCPRTHTGAKLDPLLRAGPHP